MGSTSTNNIISVINPHHGANGEKLSAGGSSGGSAAAVSAGLVWGYYSSPVWVHSSMHCWHSCVGQLERIQVEVYDYLLLIVELLGLNLRMVWFLGMELYRMLILWIRSGYLLEMLTLLNLYSVSNPFPSVLSSKDATYHL